MNHPPQPALTGLAVLTVAAAALALACAPSPAPPPPAPPVAPPAVAPAPTATPVGAQVKRGGKFIQGTHYNLPSWDPYTEGSGGFIQHTSYNTNSLMKWTLAPGVQGVMCDLCEKWEQVDDKTYVFTLRKGVKFWGPEPLAGREMTADDVIWTYQHAGTDRPRFRYRGFFQSMEKMEAPDKYTLRITLKEPNVLFALQVANPFYAILAREMGEKEADGVIQTPHGTGPFAVTNWTVKVSVASKRNPSYFEKDKPFLDEVEVLEIPDHPARFNALRAGRLDVGGSFMDASMRKTAAQDPRLTSAAAPRDTPGGIVVNLRRAPVSDVKVRRALDLAIDRQALIDANYEGEGAAYRGLISGLFPQAAYSDAELARLPGYRLPKEQDIAEAKKLLAEAGHPSGFKITMMVGKTGRNVDDATLIREDWKKIGVDVTLDVVDQAVEAERQNAGEFDLDFASGAVAEGNLDPDITWANWVPGTGKNAVWSGFTHAQWATLVTQERREKDPAKRNAVFKQILKIWEDTLPAISTVTENRIQIWNKACNGIIAESGSGDTTRWIATDAWCNR